MIKTPSPQPFPIGEGVGLAAIAAAVDPERCHVRKCVGCVTYESNPEECARCYGELYGQRAKEQSCKDGD